MAETLADLFGQAPPTEGPTEELTGQEGASPELVEYGQRLAAQGKTLSEEEVAAIAKIGDMADQLLLSGMAKKAFEIVVRSADPAEEIGRLTVVLGEKLFKEAKKKGEYMTPNVVGAIGMYILSRLIDLANAAGVFPKGATEEDIATAWSVALSMWRKIYPEHFTPPEKEDLEAMPENLKESLAREVLKQTGAFKAAGMEA